MGLGPSLPFDNENGFTDDHIIGKAMQALRLEFKDLPPSFVSSNWERARLILRVEGRDSMTVYNSLKPFAEAQSSPSAVRERRKAAIVEKFSGEFPHMTKMIEKGLI